MSALMQLYWKARGLPGQTRREIRLFKRALLAVPSTSLLVFEWGAGQSTVYYPRFLAEAGRSFEWYALDNSPAWVQRVRTWIGGTPFKDRVHLYCTEFPAFWEVPGFSVTNPPCFETFPAQGRAGEYIEFPRRLGLEFDVIIVDGRFRRRCLMTAREVLRRAGVVLLHDAHRKHYHPSLALYPHGWLFDGGRLPGSRQRSQTWVGALTDRAF